MSWRDHRFEEFTGHPVEFHLLCACTKVSVAAPGYLRSRLGDAATPRDAERRMRCQGCKSRPTVKLALQWLVSGGRDMRSDPPTLPDWMGLQQPEQH